MNLLERIGVRVERVEHCPFCAFPHAYLVVRKYAGTIGCKWWSNEWLPLADREYAHALFYFIQTEET